jgi:hypothetical protein
VLHRPVPDAGVAWRAVHPARVQALGWDVTVEDSGAPPTVHRGQGDQWYGYAVRYVADVMQRVGLGDRWAYLDMMHNETSLSRAARRALSYRGGDREPVRRHGAARRHRQARG